ncbi:hypothetical protein BDP27DRAFT_1366346 [Rhodocollybia butyracea]|uniref:Uncharacterized protein n=1 Tax=Rhodocollybia butyracea TaxID=206335 RepID=A0A9P5PKI1_9AGAR|nr:hypothetical protein BDP27DRAFT_1366346 [Rhodocollybia butyracea]
MKCLYIQPSVAPPSILTSARTAASSAIAARCSAPITQILTERRWSYPSGGGSEHKPANSATKTASSEVFSAYSEEQKSYAAGSTFYPKGVALVAFGFCCLIYGQRTAVSFNALITRPIFHEQAQYNRQCGTIGTRSSRNLGADFIEYMWLETPLPCPVDGSFFSATGTKRKCHSVDLLARYHKGMELGCIRVDWDSRNGCISLIKFVRARRFWENPPFNRWFTGTDAEVLETKNDFVTRGQTSAISIQHRFRFFESGLKTMFLGIQRG